ncbi:MAG: hypothetical protein EXS36_17280 [Pedosphaera sp.]|nr:hypothetical protein [Pedosphaera sp.]
MRVVQARGVVGPNFVPAVLNPKSNPADHLIRVGIGAQHGKGGLGGPQVSVGKVCDARTSTGRLE